MRNLINLGILSLLFLSTSLFAQSIDGIWQSEGYGHLIEISNNEMDLYQVTQISNIFDETYSLNANEIVNGDELEGVFSQSGDQLLLTLGGGTIITFNSLDELPQETMETRDPQRNFDVFWQTYEDWCGLFTVVNVDWQAEYDLYSAQITDQTTDRQLFRIMRNLLDNLNDGHSFLDPVNISGYFDGGPEISPLWSDYEYEMMDLIEDIYIDGGDYVFSNSELLSYGMIDDSVGYLAINSMQGFSNSDNELADNAALERELDVALASLQNTKALIIDVRFNTGGYDSNARIIGNRLTNRSMPVYSKQVRTGAYNEYADPTVFHIEPEGEQYLDRPVVVLTSDGTLSAADVFALLVREVDCVTLIGESTYGALSDNYTKYLPNNWEFGISPERYLSVDNINYEQLGIPPDIEVIGDMQSFNNNEDNILEVAISRIFEFCSPSFVDDLDLAIELKLFPNPTSKDLNVEIEMLDSSLEWIISDIVGKVVLEGNSETKAFKINVENLAGGVYYFSGISNQREFISKFSVQ